MTKDRVLSLRLTGEQHADLADAAANLGLSVSELTRRAALALTYPAAPPPSPFGTSPAPLVRLSWRFV